jgi:hypothetical protein
VISGLDKKGLYGRSRVLGVWDTVVGPEIAAHTSGAHLRDGELVIYVDSPVWATELASVSEKLRTSLNEALGEDLVTSVRFVVSRRVGEEQRQREEDREVLQHVRDDRDPAPLGTHELDSLERALEGIQDDALRASVRRAEAGSIGRRKAHEGSESKD